MIREVGTLKQSGALEILFQFLSARIAQAETFASFSLIFVSSCVFIHSEFWFMEHLKSVVSTQTLHFP